MRRAPIDPLPYAVEVAHRIARGDIGKAKALAVAELPVAKLPLHGIKSAHDLLGLLFVPYGALAFFFRFAIVVLDQHRSIRNAVAQRLPALDLDAVGKLIRD